MVQINREKLALAIRMPTFVLTVFVGLPAVATEINSLLEWPRWVNPWARAIGVGLISAGVATYVYCRVLFARVGKGTTSPFAPPQRMVDVGLYQYSRNPMMRISITLPPQLYENVIEVMGIEQQSRREGISLSQLK